jgi:hypothetical protein
MKNEQLKNYIQTQIAQSFRKMEGLTYDGKGRLLSKRSAFVVLRKYAKNFLNNNQEPRFVVMPGLRGVGKTTLLAQLFMDLPESNVLKIYLSVDQIVNRFEANLWEVIEIYEELLGKNLEELDKKLFIFLDEIHYDKKWAGFLKSLYDRTDKVAVFCTGSAALLLKGKSKDDIARRAFYCDIFPVSFAEYMLFKYNKHPISGLGNNVRSAILKSSNAQEVYDKLNSLDSQFKSYWLDVNKFEILRYLKLGTFPFTLKLENEIVATNFISQIISKVIYTDIPQFHNFETETLNRIDKILYLISDTLGVSVTKLSETLEINPDTLRMILGALEEAGLITRIPPYGKHFKQVKKPSKYLFATPALRYSYLSSRESINSVKNYKGSLLEDVAGMYLNRILSSGSYKYSLTYDVSEGGADFVISVGYQNIVMEIGAGGKTYKQISKTAQKVNPKYSIIVSDNELEYSNNYNAVKIPLSYFLLI